MSAEQRLRAPRRKITRNGHVVRVYQPTVGGALYVPIIPAWGAAGLRRALNEIDGSRSQPGPHRRRDPER